MLIAVKSDNLLYPGVIALSDQLDNLVLAPAVSEILSYTDKDIICDPSGHFSSKHPVVKINHLWLLKVRVHQHVLSRTKRTHIHSLNVKPLSKYTESFLSSLTLKHQTVVTLSAFESRPENVQVVVLEVEIEEFVVPGYSGLSTLEVGSRPHRVLETHHEVFSHVAKVSVELKFL